MNILYCGDANIADGVLMSALSLARNTLEALDIYILTASIDSENAGCTALSPAFASFLSGVLRRINEKNTVTLTDISDKMASCLPAANMKTRFTPCCMLRLFADEVECIPEKILYLDNDVICRGDFSKLYYTDISGCDFGGVLDFYGSWLFYNGHIRRNYINSGVLLLNMARIRENGLFFKCREMCRTKKMFMPDQSALNKLSDAKMLCERKYNEQRRQGEDTVLRHFTTSFRFFPVFRKISVKPWNEEGMHKILKTHEYDSLISECKRLKAISDNFTKEAEI